MPQIADRHYRPDCQRKSNQERRFCDFPRPGDHVNSLSSSPRHGHCHESFRRKGEPGPVKLKYGRSVSAIGRIITGNASHGAGRTGTRRPDSALGLAQGHPVPGSRGERPPGVDQSLFTHHFKRLVGVTPGQFGMPARIASNAASPSRKPQDHPLTIPHEQRGTAGRQKGHWLTIAGPRWQILFQECWPRPNAGSSAGSGPYRGAFSGKADIEDQIRKGAYHVWYRGHVFGTGAD